jgi:hypothetical protein
LCCPEVDQEADEMSTAPDWIREAVSPPRFAPYLTSCRGDLAVAAELYWWNIAVSEAFYAPLHCLEVSLRNAAHQQLARRFDRSDWWHAAPLTRAGLRLVADAEEKLVMRGRARTSDDMVAALSFGFWVSLFSRTFDRSLWVPGLHSALPHYRGPRRVLHRELHSVLLFRNRIMHHEPVHNRHLEADHRTIRRLLGYVSPAMAHQLERYDRVPEVLGLRPAASSTPPSGNGR